MGRSRASLFGSLDIEGLTNDELELVGSRGKRASSFRAALRLMEAGQVDLERIIGARLLLDEWEAALELVAGGMKVLLEVRPEENWMADTMPAAPGRRTDGWSWSSRYAKPSRSAGP